MQVPDAGEIAQDQHQLIEANDVTVEIDMDGTCEDLAEISNFDISDEDLDWPRELNMYGSPENLVESGSTKISFQDKKKPSVNNMFGMSGILDVTIKNEISNLDTERPKEMGTDITTSGDFAVIGNTQITSQDKKRPSINGTSGDLVMSGNTTITPCVKKRPSLMPSESRPAKKELRIKEALSEMASAVKALVNKKEKNNNKSFENALSALQAMPDIDDELVMEACDLLEDERKTEIFLALNVSLRKKWLLRKLRW